MAALTGKVALVAGGRGIAVQVDHLVSEQVAALVQRIESEQGALHVIVNDIWGATKMEWDKTVWESDLDNGLRTLRLAIDEVIAAMRGEPWASFELTGERVHELTEQSAVVAYRAKAERNGVEYEALFSSTYVRTDAGWKLSVHQQTPV